MTIDTKQLRKIAEAATQGEWERGTGYGCCVVFPPTGEAPLCIDAQPQDASHIATFDPPTVLALLDEVERLQGANETLFRVALRAEAENKLLREALGIVEVEAAQAKGIAEVAKIESLSRIERIAAKATLKAGGG